MLKKKPVLLFLLKSFLILAVLSLPVSFFDSVYGTFYKTISKSLFGKIRETGFANFSITKPKSNLHIEIGNTVQVKSNGMTNTATSDVNIRFRGYIPTVFLLSLILASPIPRKRKLLASFAGTTLVTCLIMFYQWIHLIYICQQAKWLDLYKLSPSSEKKIDLLYHNFANYSGSSFVFVIAIWFLVSFRKGDLERLKSNQI